jgi:hypothetical protein
MKNINEFFNEEIKQKLFTEAKKDLNPILDEVIADEQWYDEDEASRAETQFINHSISLVLYDYFIDKPYYLVKIKILNRSNNKLLGKYIFLIDLEFNFIDEFLV